MAPIGGGAAPGGGGAVEGVLAAVDDVAGGLLRASARGDGFGAEAVERLDDELLELLDGLVVVLDVTDAVAAVEDFESPFCFCW